jgi:hypothetical protein
VTVSPQRVSLTVLMPAIMYPTSPAQFFLGYPDDLETPTSSTL